MHELVFIPGSNTQTLSGHDGGLSITTDITASNGVPPRYTKPHPVTWSFLNNGLYTTQAYAIAIDPTTKNSATIVAGFQDNGNYRTTAVAETTPWIEEPYGGDGAWNAVSSGGGTWYISQQYGTVQRNSTSTPNGSGVNPSSRGSSGTNTFISPFILDRNDSKIMYYAANEELWRHNYISTVTGGSPFSGISDGWILIETISPLIGDITAMETSVSPANVLYIGTSKGKVYKISNAHTGSSVTLTNISAGFVSCIDVDPDNADHVYVTFSNYGIISIYKSTDAGQSWTNISGNLEENADGSGSGPAIRWIHVFKKKDGTNVYLVGATTGLYSTSTLSGTSTVWTQEGVSTIGNVPVSMIRSRKIDGYVAVGTHGKGMFSTNILSTPFVTDLSPSNGATGVKISDNMTITFSENVADAGGKVIIKKSSDNSIVESMAVSSTNISIVDAIATINPTNNLEGSTDYYVEVEANAFKDVGGNKYAGIDDKTSWHFTTTALLGFQATSIENQLKIMAIDHGVNIEFLGQKVKSAEINLYSLDGKQAIYTVKSSFKYNSINVKANLKPGTYIVKASTARGVYTQKFLIAE